MGRKDRLIWTKKIIFLGKMGLSQKAINPSLDGKEKALDNYALAKKRSVFPFPTSPPSVIIVFPSLIFITRLLQPASPRRAASIVTGSALQLLPQVISSFFFCRFLVDFFWGLNSEIMISFDWISIVCVICVMFFFF